jgi:hypothetical protein
MSRPRTLALTLAAVVVLALPASALAAPAPGPTPAPPATAPAATVPGVQVGPPLPAPAAGPGGSTTVDGDQASHPHFWDLPGRIKQSINDWFKGLVVDALTPMLDLVGKTVLSAPQLASNSQIAGLWKISLLTADALLVLFVLVGAGLAMSYETMQTRYALKDLLGRLALAGIAINASLALTGQLIELANALAAGVLGGSASAAGAAGSLNTLVVGALSGGGIFVTLLGLGCAVAAVVLLVLYLLRAAIVVVLVCAAPLLLLCHLFPQSEGLAQLWWRAMAAAFGIQVAQALVLATAVRVFFAAPGGSGLGLSVTGAVIDMLVCLCLLFVLVKIPFWAKDLALTRSGPSTAVRLARIYVARQTGLPRGLL